jgi:hypothetical protein
MADTETQIADDPVEDRPEDRDYHEQSVQQRMNRPTPQQQRTAGRKGGEDIEGQTPVDRVQGQGATNTPEDEI